jgi:hypothetical protein
MERKRAMKIRIFLIALIIAALPTAAFADPSGTGFTCVGYVCTAGTINYSFSTTSIYDTSYSAVTQQVNTYATEIIGLMQGGTTLYDQTFNVAFTDPTVQAALVTAKGVLTGSGATSFIGPTLLSDSTSLFSSVALTGSPVVTSTDESSAITMYLGPQTIMIGENQLWTLPLLGGQVDYDTLLTYLIHQTITTTTTDTYLIKDVYELVGVTSTSIPTLNEWGIAIMGILLGLSVLYVMRRKRIV